MISFDFWGFAEGWFLKRRFWQMFPKRWFWQMFPCTKKWNEGTFGCSSVPKTGTRVHSRVPGNKNWNNGTFAKTALLRNRPNLFPLDFFLGSRIFSPLREEKTQKTLCRVAQESNRNQKPEPSEPFFPKPKAEPEPHTGTVSQEPKPEP